MADDKNAEAAMELFDLTFKNKGVAVSIVKDGFVLAFKRDTMQQLLTKYPDNDQFVIFVKNPTFTN